jgi:hypothetical protein
MGRGLAGLEECGVREHFGQNRTVRIIDILTPKSVLDEKPKSLVTVRVLPNLRGSSLHLAKLLNALEIREPEPRSRL